MCAFFISPSTLREKGILAMNRRNLDFIFKFNERSKYPLVDDKEKTKKVLQATGLKTPPLIGVIRYFFEIRRFEQLVGNYAEFVIKPAHGCGGDGILVITGRDGDKFICSGGKVIGRTDIERHLANILSGLHSLGGHADVVLFEGLIHFDLHFANLAAHGVPDIRVLVFRGYPVMAMLRIPTRSSHGKANLHQGAVGVGLDLKTGRGLCGVQFNRIIQRHPDLDMLFEEIHIPDWHEMLSLASRGYDVTGLGYLGADLVIDARHGPQILELNARPGLSIQLANDCGLLPRLRKIQSLQTIPPESTERVSQACEWFYTDLT